MPVRSGGLPPNPGRAGRPALPRHAAQELISAATHKTMAEVQQLLAERFPRPDVPTRILPMSEDGRRCEERKFVELDHVEGVARGGEPTESNLRLLCRAHNQFQAECTCGSEFMRHKRTATAEARAAAKHAASGSALDRCQVVQAPGTG